jgi:gliding motility-associated-like protein
VGKAAFGGTARQFAVGFAIGTKGYVGTGWDQGIGYRNDFWEYDPATNTWTQRANFGGGQRILAVGFGIGTKGYISTGQDFVGRLKDLWEYNPTTNTWAQKANFGGAARSRAVGIAIGTKGYVGTGYEDNTNTYYADFWEYNPTTDVWTKRADFGGGLRREATGFYIGNKGYLGTGYNGTQYKNDLWEYNPATDVWTSKANIPTAQWLAVGFSIGSKGYVGIGYGLSNPLKEFWEYDPAANSWSKKEDFGGTARFAAVGFSIGLKGYVGTGLDNTGSRTRDFWEYQPTYIVTGNISLSKICVSKTSSIPISVPYTISTSFNVGNVFTAQLSDSSGSFATPLNIGTRTDTGAGTINALIPANQTYGHKYRIRVVSSNPAFIGSDNKNDLSINPKPVPSVTVNDTIQCLVGNLFAFNNTSTVPFGAITSTFWSFGDGKTANTLNTSHVFTADGIFSVKMKTTTDSGCADSIFKSMRIMPSPKASFTSSDTGMCFLGNFFVFTNKTTIKTGTFTTKWYMGNNDSSTSTDLSYSYPKPGKYNLRLVAYSNLGCNDTAKQLIQVDSVPNVGFTINDSTQCFGNNLFVFTNSSTNAQSFLWTFGDGDTSTSRDPSHFYATENFFDVELKAYSNPKCYDSLKKRVFVNAVPVASFTVDKDTQCLGTNVFNCTNLSTISSGSYTSLWKFGDGNTSTTQHASYTYTVAQNYDIVLVVTSNNGCIDSTSVPVIVLNTVTLSKTSNNGPVCEGEQLELYTDTIPFAKFVWTGPNGFTSTIQSPVIPNANISNNGTYQVTATLLGGCTTMPATTDATVTELPDSPLVTSTVVHICESQTLQLFASSATPGATFYWTGPKGFTSNVPDPAIPNMTLSQAGNYKVTATVNGCEGPPTNVMVYLHFTPDIYLGKDTNVCKGDQLRLDPGVYKSYLWQDGSTGRYYDVIEKGKYWVQVISDYDCYGSDTITFGDLCPPTFWPPNAFTPNNDTWNDIFIPQGNNIFDFQMQIFDKWGVMVFESKSLEIGWDGKFNGQDCPVDVYYWYCRWRTIWLDEEKNNVRTGSITLTR